MTVTKRIRVLGGYTIAYLLVAGSLMLSDALLTNYLMDHSSNAYEMNVKVDATSLGTLLVGVPKSLAIFTSIFFVSLTLCLANEKYRKLFEMKSRWDEIFISLSGAASIWNLLLIFGALINNGGMILFEFSWYQSAVGLIGLTTDNERMASFVLFPLVSMVILLVPTLLIFSRIVARAKRSIPEFNQ